MNKKSMGVLLVGCCIIVTTFIIGLLNSILGEPTFIFTLVAEVIGLLGMVFLTNTGNMYAKTGISVVVGAYIVLSIGLSLVVGLWHFVDVKVFYTLQVVLLAAALCIGIVIMMNGSKDLSRY